MNRLINTHRPMSKHKIIKPNNRRERIRNRWYVWQHRFWAMRYTGFVAFLANTIGRIEHRQIQKKKAAGETIWVDDVFAPPVDEKAYAQYEYVPANMEPQTGLKARKAKVMKQKTYPTTNYSFKYRMPPISGNTLNGVGEENPRRAKQPFFSKGYSGPWNKLERLFQGINKPALANFILKIFWMDRKRVGEVASVQREITDRAAMSQEIKELAKKHGANLVGIAELKDHMRFEGFDLPFSYAIALAIPMDRETMVQAPTHGTSLHIQETYKKVGEIAIKLAHDIRKMGWPARASTNISPDTYEILHIPVAVDAGIGTLGKHGSLISKTLGSNIRLATVLTDLPLSVDGPEEIGVDEFCLSCQICSTNCPPQAIFDTKKMVRGEEKWYVDFDTCVPYFVEHDGCGICLEVCPWSEAGRGPLISEKMLTRLKKEE